MNPVTAVDTTAGEVRAATRATYIAFIANGFAMSSWATRIPQVRDGLHLTPSRLGFVLLAMAAGSIVSLPLAGHIVTHFGSRRTVTAMAGLLGVSISGVGLGYLFGVIPVVVGLVFLGFANGAWDVAMNVQGAEVERRLGRAIMPRFHAGFSVGTVAGGLVGVAMVALRVPVTAHLIGSGVVVAAVVIYAVRGFAPDHGVAESHASPETTIAESGWRRTLAAWREPRTLLVGLLVLTFAFTEGAGIDWISISMIDGYRVVATVGTLAYSLFLASMTAGRWFGPQILDRYGRVPVIRVLAGVSVVGLALFIFGPNPAVAFLGTIFWGLGASLGFPVGMSAAADEPKKSAARVSVVASIGYCAFLGGPPLIGFLGDHITTLKALLAVGVALMVAIAVAGSLRPLKQQ